MSDYTSIQLEDYKVLLHPQSLQRAARYWQQIQQGSIQAGRFLQQQRQHQDSSQWTTEDFLQALCATKRPRIFAESEVIGDGSDWTLEELGILGDISVAVPVVIYDNGRHHNPLVHEVPFEGMLLYTAGALLRSGKLQWQPSDWADCVNNNSLHKEGYYQLYARRLWPVFAYANAVAEAQQKQGLITIPGLGCGQFAGIFQGQLGAALEQVLIRFLQHYSTAFPAIKGVYYDPYGECENAQQTIHHLTFLTRPLLQGNAGQSQLSTPNTFNEEGLDFSDCFLFSLVAWDHVSWPGNDFYAGARATDDGVKAAATDSMFCMTTVEGQYSKTEHAYLPPKDYWNWNAVIARQHLQMQIKGNLFVPPLP
ncbi:MAG: hypothetical protein AB8E82_19860 [Aureispira sp.]